MNHARTFATVSGYDRAEIMAFAADLCREVRDYGGSSYTWQQMMADALRFAWGRARRQRAAALAQAEAA